MDKEKIEAFFDRNLNLWRVDLAEKCLDDSKEGAELRAEYKLRIYKEAEQLQAENEKLSEQYDQLHIEFVATKRQLEADNERLKEENRWIPVSERLPDENECDEVLFIDEGLMEAGEFKNGLFWNNGGKSFEKVTHWKPITLPEQALSGGKDS